MTWKKRIISIALCLCALLCAASVRAEAADHTNHLVCGGTTCNHTGENHSTGVSWQAWNGTGNITYTNNVAYIYLSDDVTLQINNDFGKPKSLDVGNGKTLYLCLNGHSLTNRGSNTICVYGTLVLCDCKGGGQNNGTITHTKDTDGSFTGSEGIHVNSGATFTMYGGTISGNNGGVQVYKSTFTMYGGKISGNADRGVLVSGGTFTMYGGEISHNTCITTSAEGGGGVWVKDSGSNIGNFAMYGGKISNNTYKGTGNCGGGGVYASGTGDFIIQGGEIANNQCSYNATNTSATTSGGGLYISGKPGKLKIENCTISNNTCDGDGGGIFINCQNVIGTITGCTISGNEAGGNGGGFASQDCILTIGNCNITNNRTAGKGGAMAVGSWGEDSKITLSGSMNFSGNQDNYPADESGNLTTGTENDVHLNTSSVYLRLASDFSKTSGAIVVTTSSEPTNKTVKIAEGIAGAANAADFTYGNGSTIGIIAKTNNGKVELLACKHNYSTKKDATNHWQECSICKDKKDVTEHAYSNTWKKNSTQHWHECECGAKSGEADHAYSNEWKTGDGKHWHECACGQKSGEAAHSYSTAWDRDNTSHFHKCSACGDKTDIAICVYKARVTSGHQKSDATCTAKAVYWKSCVCDRESTETFESGETNPDNHTGTLGSWQSNDDGHWKEYSCCQTKVQEGTHNWNEGEVTTPATCTAAGERTYTCTACSATKTETIPATGHAWDTEWSKDNDHHWHKCNNANCDAVKDKAEHRWNEGEVTTSPTCTTAGERTYTCTACSATKKETIPATGHAWDTEWSKDNDHHWHKCKNCNAIDESTKAAHTWDEGKVTTPATCTTPGEKTYTCMVCSATKKETIPATGHAWDTEWSKDNDHHWHKCNNANCDAVKDKAEHRWNEGEVTTSPTCTTAGERTYTCTACSATKKETIPATGHAWDTEWSKDNDHHWHKCKNCNAIDESTKASHTWNEGKVTTPATCTTDGERTYTCAVCSATKKETIPATGHTPGAAVRENKVAATCTTAGSYDEVVYCTACGNEVSRTQKTIDKLAHDYDTTKWVKADENQHGHKCKNCDAITDLTAHVPGAAATETTPQLCTECGYVIAPATHPVHTWVFVAETPATCNAAGEREHYKCTCGRTSFKNGDVYDINEDVSVLTIAASHTGNIGEQWHSDSANHWQEYTCCHARANEAAHSGGAATCTAQAVCQVCGRAYGAALGHDWGAWKVTTPATKDAPGVETRTCAYNSAHTETRSIPKLSTTVYTVSEDTKIAQIEAKVDGLDKILELNENKALVNDGKSVGVSLTVKNTASSGVSEKIKEKLAGSNLVGLRLELTVEKTVTANGVVESKQTIPDAGVLLKTTITLPAELQGKSGYVVYRLHDENVHVLTETANENGEFISVSADKTQITICARLYSEYVIAYQTGGSSGGGYHPVNPTPVKATSANTGDAGVLLYGVTAALSLTGTAWLGAKSRKH